MVPILPCLLKSFDLFYPLEVERSKTPLAIPDYVVLSTNEDPDEPNRMEQSITSRTISTKCDNGCIIAETATSRSPVLQTLVVGTWPDVANMASSAFPVRRLRETRTWMAF